MYLNPTDPTFGGSNFYVAGTVGGTSVDAVSISSVNLRQGTATSAPGVTVDNITVAVPDAVPEPASLGVLALGGMALLARRRK